MPPPYGLLEPIDLPLPHLPARLEGVRIAHLSDLHLRRPTHRHRRLVDQLTRMRLHLVLLTGDYMDKSGDEPAALQGMRELLAAVQPSLGSFGVFGNHDTPALRDAFAELPVQWLSNRAYRFADQPMELMGLDMLRNEQPDSVALVLQREEQAAADRADAVDDAAPPVSGMPAGERPLRLLLCHHPSWVTTAADLGADLVLSGHTHGGQVRLPTGHALVNSCDLPLKLTAGLLRQGDTLMSISRGIGATSIVPRLFCRPHVPVYTLRRQTLPGERSEHIRNLKPW